MQEVHEQILKVLTSFYGTPTADQRDHIASMAGAVMSEAVSPEVERLRAELAEAKRERDVEHDKALIASGAHNGGQLSCKDVTALLRAAEAQRDTALHSSTELGKTNVEWQKAQADALTRAFAAEAELDALKAAIADVAEAIHVAHRIMACSSHDWSQHPDDAWLYALLVGWDCELPEHANGNHDPIDCSGSNHLESFAERFGWTDGGVAKLRKQRCALAALDAPETPGDTVCSYQSEPWSCRGKRQWYVCTRPEGHDDDHQLCVATEG